MTEPSPKIVLFVNGDLPSPENILSYITPEDVLIAVDGGLDHLTRLELKPDLIIGDLDSADPDQIQRFRSQGVEIRQHPTHKDETDLELALNHALSLSPAPIWIVAAFGKRLDHTLGNIFLLLRSEFEGLDVRLVDGTQEVFLIHHQATIEGQVGQRLSLLPINGPATEIYTTGLQYPLQGETLFPERSRGISNRITSPPATVTLTQGVLLCIHETKTTA